MGERIWFMRFYPIRILLLFSALATACTTPGVTPDVTNKNQPRSAVATDSPANAGGVEEELERRLKTICDRAEGTVSLSLVHIESGKTISINGKSQPPLYSVFKFPLAI